VVPLGLKGFAVLIIDLNAFKGDSAEMLGRHPVGFELSKRVIFHLLHDHGLNLQEVQYILLFIGGVEEGVELGHPLMIVS